MTWGWSDICIEIQRQITVFIYHSYTGPIVVAMKQALLTQACKWASPPRLQSMTGTQLGTGQSWNRNEGGAVQMRKVMFLPCTAALSLIHSFIHATNVPNIQALFWGLGIMTRSSFSQRSRSSGGTWNLAVIWCRKQSRTFQRWKSNSNTYIHLATSKGCIS